MLAFAKASLAGSTPEGKEFPTPKNCRVGAGMKKSTSIKTVKSELLVMDCVSVPDATKVCGGREFWKKNPFAPTPKSPKPVAADEANAVGWLVGMLGNGIARTSFARTRAFTNVRLLGSTVPASKSLFAGRSCVVNSAKAVSMTSDTSMRSARLSIGVNPATSSTAVDKMRWLMRLSLPCIATFLRESWTSLSTRQPQRINLSKPRGPVCQRVSVRYRCAWSGRLQPS